jgi:hypothetical protein
MTRQSLIRLAAGAAVAGLVGLAAGPAFATTSSSVPGASGNSPSANTKANPADTLAKIQAAARAAIDQRLSSLNQVITVLNGTTSLGSDQATLVGTAKADIAGLTTLEATIAADTTVQQARTDAQTIFTGYRVFALVIPVDHMVRVTDGITNVVVPKLTALETKWAGLNDPAIATLLADMQSQTQAAGQAVTGLPATLEGYTPAPWNANHSLLSGARSTLATARQDLEKARQDAKQIVGILRSEHHQKRASSVSSSTTSSSVVG